MMKYWLSMLFMAGLHTPAEAQFSKAAKDSASSEIREIQISEPRQLTG